MCSEIQHREHWRKKWQNNKGDLNPLEEKAEEKDQSHHKQEYTPGAEAKVIEHGADKIISAEGAKNERKDCRTDKDHEQHRVRQRRALDTVSPEPETPLSMKQ